MRVVVCLDCHARMRFVRANRYYLFYWCDNCQQDDVIALELTTRHLNLWTAQMERRIKKGADDPVQAVIDEDEDW